MRFLAPALTLLVFVSAPAVSGADFAKDLQAALGPYYAALVASARGDVDETERHLVVFLSKWTVVSRVARADAPASLGADPEWQQLVKRVPGTVTEARNRCHKRDTAGAYGVLETIRTALRQLDARHHMVGVDDYLTDFQVAMQRLKDHAGGMKEAVLTPKDQDTLLDDYEAATDAWNRAAASAGPLGTSTAWQTAASNLSATLGKIGQNIRIARRTDALLPAIEELREQYYTLLLAVAKARS